MHKKVAEPNLIDDSARFYMEDLLQKAHTTRMKYHQLWFNGLLVFLFVVIFGGILYYRYKTRPSPQESFNRLMSDQEYVLSKIRFFKEENQRIHAMSSPITNLPTVGEGEMMVPLGH
jgi:hypothetical protein